MSEVVGCVACGSLKDVCDRLDHAVDVRYIPHELHESPVDPGDDEAIASRVQEAVSALEAAGIDPIAICYSTAGDWLDSVDTKESTLRVWTVEDAVSALLLGEDTEREPPLKATRTYYLTPGIIDHGLDPLKVYHAYRGDEHRLLNSFERASVDREDASVTWFEGERYRELVPEQPVGDPSTVDTFFSELLGYYEHVVLLDTGSVDAFHRRYAKRLGDLLERIEPDSTVSVSVEPCSDAFIRAMVTPEGQTIPAAFEPYITHRPP